MPAHAQEVPELNINSRRYIVVDADTGEIFAQRGSRDRVAVASLTKVFTAIEAIERGSLDMEITTREGDVFSDNSTRVGFGVGETFTLRDLLYGMMLPSGNDAAYVIARALGTQDGDATGDEGVARFVSWMNQRMANMGLEDTNLVNPYGWGVEGHYSTAYDIAAFTRYALLYPTFIDLISTKYYSTSNGYELANTNKLLGQFSLLIGGKTGYDDDAGYCLVEVATRNGNTMISVTLDGVAPDDWYDDNVVLLNYAFDQKEARQAAGEGLAGEVAAYRDPDAAVIEQIAKVGGSLGGESDDPGAIPSADGGTPNPDLPAGSPVATVVPPSASATARPPGFGAALLVAGVVAIAVLAVSALRTIGGLAGLSGMPRVTGRWRQSSAPPANPPVTDGQDPAPDSVADVEAVEPGPGVKREPGDPGD